MAATQHTRRKRRQQRREQKKPPQINTDKHRSEKLQSSKTNSKAEKTSTSVVFGIWSLKVGSCF
jgi:hypothetical protein